VSAVAKRIYHENLALQEEMAILRAENQRLKQDQARLERQAKLAYLEGVDQGRAQGGLGRAS